MPEVITSRDNERVKYARHIARSAAFRAGEGLFFAEGIRLCEDLMQSAAPRMLFATQRVLQKHPGFAAAGEVYEISDSVAEKLGEGKTNQGVFALFAIPVGGYAGLGWPHGVVLCEAVQNPANLGAILRSAAAFGLGGAVLGTGCADPFGPKALRASAGAALRLPLVAGAGIPEAVTAAHAAGATVYGAVLEGAERIDAIKPEKPFVLMVGNEGAGLSAEAVALCDARVCIPMHGGVESLNAAVAAGVLMYEFSRKI